MMTPEFQCVLKQLVEGELEPEAWLKWWNEHGDEVKMLINHGQWLRLKPRSSRGSPACRAASESQLEACKLLDEQGIDNRRSNRYRAEWETWFNNFRERCEQETKERQKACQPIIESLKPDFLKFADWLLRNTELIESVATGASQTEISAREETLKRPFPKNYKLFLNHCAEIDLGESLKLGLPYTFQHEYQNLISFGECWLEGDGDQVLFADASDNLSLIHI